MASFPFNSAVIACIWYFNNNIFSVIIPLAFDNNNLLLIQVFRLRTWVLLAIYFFLHQSQKKILMSIFLFLKFNYLLKEIKFMGP